MAGKQLHSSHVPFIPRGKQHFKRDLCKTYLGTDLKLLQNHPHTLKQLHCSQQGFSFKNVLMVEYMDHTCSVPFTALHSLLRFESMAVFNVNCFLSAEALCLWLELTWALGKNESKIPSQTEKEDTAGLLVGNSAFGTDWITLQVHINSHLNFFCTKTPRKLKLQECFMYHSICSSRKTEKVLQTAAVILSQQHHHTTARQ